MINNYQDAMAIYMAYENLDLFITFTCNTNWPEIQRKFKKDRVFKHEDKPNTITRVFRAKVLDMLKFIKSSVLFGKTIVVNRILTISFSFSSCIFFLFIFCAIEFFFKKGLPNTYILV